MAALRFLNIFPGYISCRSTIFTPGTEDIFGFYLKPDRVKHRSGQRHMFHLKLVIIEAYLIGDNKIAGALPGRRLFFPCQPRMNTALRCLRFGRGRRPGAADRRPVTGIIA